MTGCYTKRNTGLKWVKVYRSSQQRYLFKSSEKKTKTISGIINTMNKNLERRPLSSAEVFAS